MGVGANVCMYCTVQSVVLLNVLATAGYADGAILYYSGISL